MSVLTLTLSDEIRHRLPRDPVQALTSKQLFDRCELAHTVEDISKTLAAMYKRGELARTEAKPFAYWLATERSFAAAPVAAQPEVAQNTGSARPRSLQPRPAGAVAQSTPAAAPPSAAGGDVLRCALWNDGSLVIEAGAQRIALSREQTGLLFAYLERVAEVPS